MLNFKNQSGSALIYAIMALSILGGAGLNMFQKSQQAKEAAVGVANSQYMRLFKRKISSMLTDPLTCSTNFANKALDAQVPLMKDTNGNTIYQNGKYYYGKAIYFSGMTPTMHPTDPDNHFILTINVSKSHGKQVQRQEQILRFNMVAEMDGVTIKNCRLNSTPANLEQIYAEEIARQCQGPGVISNTDGHCVIAQPHPGLAKPVCPAGQAIASITLDSSNQLQTHCAPMITQVGTGNVACAHGIRYTGTAGKYECLSLSQIVNPATTTVAVGKKCFITVESQQFIFKCLAATDPDPIPNPPMTPSCFVAGTLVSLYDGEIKHIEDVKAADVLQDGDGQAVTVLKLLTHDYHGPLYSINGGGYFFTPNHPFKTISGWKSLDPEASKLEIPNLPISKMQLGDVLLKKDGLELIHSLDSIETSEKVYNFALSGSHEYIANEYVVHNKNELPCSQNPSSCSDGSSPLYCNIGTDASTGKQCLLYKCGNCAGP